MTLYTGCIYTNSHRGSRISVVSLSPPWNGAPQGNGTVLFPKISPDLFDQCWMELSPPPDLVAEYYHHNLPWEKFRKDAIVGFWWRKASDKSQIWKWWCGKVHTW